MNPISEGDGKVFFNIKEKWLISDATCPPLCLSNSEFGVRGENTIFN
jgi:hypothetical protein